MKYYQENAKQYAGSTFNQEFADAVFSGFEDFLILNQMNQPLLDIGCGSGRDALNLIKKGYSVDAFDQSEEMIKEAKSLTQLNNVFNVGSAQEFKSEKTYSFAYSIACLLHLNDNDFLLAIENIFKHINCGGHFYFTLKKGEGQEIDSNGRFFNYYTNEKICAIFKKLNLNVIDISENQDVSRPDTTWLNILIEKPL